MSGWIKLHRAITDWEWFDDEKTLKVFLYLILHANHEDRRWKGQVIKRGQIVTGVPRLAELTKLSEKVVRTRLAWLEKTGEVARKRASKYSIVTICNYDKYQLTEDQAGQAKGRQRAGKGQQTRIKECKEGTLLKESTPTADHQRDQRSQASKEKHGEFGRVWLAPAEVARYTTELGPARFAACVAKLDAWIESNPIPKRLKNGRNAAACFRSWVIRAVQEDELRANKAGAKTAAQRKKEWGDKVLEIWEIKPEDAKDVEIS